MYALTTKWVTKHAQTHLTAHLLILQPVIPLKQKNHETSEIIGNVGAGTGATVGKIGGMNYAQKSGLGIHSVRVGKLTLTAIVVVKCTR